MDCVVCKRVVAKAEAKTCSKSCRYKINTLLWSLKYMVDHGTLEAKHLEFFKKKLS